MGDAGSPARDDGELPVRRGVAVNRCVDGAPAGIGMALHQDGVQLLDDPPLECALQGCVRAVTLGYHHGARRSGVEAVRDPLPFGGTKTAKNAGRTMTCILGRQEPGLNSCPPAAQRRNCLGKHVGFEARLAFLSTLRADQIFFIVRRECQPPVMPTEAATQSPLHAPMICRSDVGVKAGRTRLTACKSTPASYRCHRAD